uniref:Tail sheath protein C-terminal domain-containing protein n=1 Tax=candidate division WOR-3 bacterium TaxID=2052148 RepID=A0A7C6A7S9_UNCW3
MAQYDLPDVYTEEIAPSGAPVLGVGTGTIGLVGKFRKGDKNKNIRCGNWEQFVENFGGLCIGSAAYDAYFAYKNKAPAIVVVRVEGTHATQTIKDRQTTPADKLKLTALIDGEFANYDSGPPKTGIQAVIADGTITNTFKLTLIYWYVEKGEQASYVETFDNLSIDSTNSRYFPTIINGQSFLVSVEDLAPNNQTPPGHLPAVGTYSLTGGVEPNYTGTTEPEGIDVLEKEDDLNIVITDKDDSVTRGLQIDHCNLMNERITVLNPAPYMTVAEVKALGDALDEDRAILTYPYCIAYDPVMKAVRSFRPAAFYAGLLARLDPYLSPSNHQPYGVLDLERQLSRADLVALQNSKISPIYTWGTRGIRVRNGINCSSDINLSQIYRRRMADFIMESVEDSSGWAVSLPITEANRNALLSSLTVWFRNLQLAGWIEGFFVKCDEENNPPEVQAARKIIVRYGVKLWNVMDYVIFEAEIGPNVIITTEGGA